jgi:hypothetical protein
MRCAKGRSKPGVHRRMPGAGLSDGCSGKVLSEMPAFQPYWGKPAVRNDRGDSGNVGIIFEARSAPLSYPTAGGISGGRPYRDKNRTTSCLPFVMLKCPVFQPQHRGAITLPQRFERACRAGRLSPSPQGLESRRLWSRPGSLRPPLRRLRLRSPRLSRRLQSRR